MSDTRGTRSRSTALATMALLALAWQLCVSAPALATDKDKPARAHAEAIAAIELGRHSYERGEYAEAVKMFHRAWSLERVPEYLYNAARAEQRAFLLDEAERDFLVLLRIQDLDETIAKPTRLHLKEITETRARLAQQKKQAEADKRKVVLAATTRGPSWRSLAGWSGLGLGAAVAATGGLLWLNVASDQESLDEVTAIVDANGAITGIDHDDYSSQQFAINDRRNTCVALTSAGVVLATAGAILLWTSPAAAEIQPSVTTAGPHLTLTLRF